MKKQASHFLLILFLLVLSRVSLAQSFDLVAEARKASWFNDQGKALPFPGNPADPKGFARILSVKMEDGKTYPSALQTHPRWVSNGWIEGRYQVSIPEEAFFEATVGFKDGARGSDGVIFEVIWRPLQGGQDILLREYKKNYTGQLVSFKVDLSNLAARSGLFVIRVKAGESSGQDWAVWVSAKIQSRKKPDIITARPAPKPAKPEAKLPQPTARPAQPVKPTPAVISLPLDKIIQAVGLQSRYHLRIEHVPASLIQEGDVDEERQSLYFHVSHVRSNLPPVKFFWVGDKAWALNAVTQHWLRIAVPKHFPSYLKAVAEVLRQKKIASAREEREFWVVEPRLEDLPIIKDPRQFFLSLFGEPRNEDESRLFAHFSTLARDLEIKTALWISKSDFQVKKYSIQTLTSQSKSELIYTFSAIREEIPPLPALAAQAKGPEFPLPMLFLRLKSIAGWIEPNHCQFAQKSLDLIQEQDGDGKYAEIYSSKWGNRYEYIREEWRPGKYYFNRTDERNHPIICGAEFEDAQTRPSFYDDWLAPFPDNYFHNDYYRDYHHFGGEDTGLLWDFLFELRGYPEPPVGGPFDPRLPALGGRYYSARDWAYGGDRIDPNLNRLTFTEAIRQYAKGTFESKRAAYLMLGHVIHLLQDQAMPDHANLKAHPGSSMTEREAYERFYVCEIIAAQAAAAAFTPCCLACGPMCPLCGAVCAGGAYAIAAAACVLAIDDEEMGYERLVLDKWGPMMEARIGAQVERTGVIKKDQYDAYFRDLSRLSKSKARELNLDAPLGMQLIPIIYLGAPYAAPIDPEIDSDDPGETAPYYELTDFVVPQAIGMGAGLIQHFFEIVNPPPYIEEIVISQEGRKRVHISVVDLVEGFGIEKTVRRERRVLASRTLYQGIPAEITLKFGPKSIDSKQRPMQTIHFTVDSLEVPFHLSPDPGNFVYQGSFHPECETLRTETLKNIRIDASENGAHLEGRVPFGNRIDRNPETIAAPALSSPFNWTGYEADGPQVETIKVGIVGASWLVERLFDFSVSGSSDPDSFRWTVARGETIRANLRIVEDGTEDRVLRGGCGQYRVIVPDVVERIHPEPRQTGRLREDFGLTCTLDDPLSDYPVLTIACDLSAPTQTYLLPIIIQYEYTDGSGRVVELLRGEREIRVVSKELASVLRRGRERGGEAEVFKEFIMLDRLGLIDLREGPPQAFDPCELSPILCDKFPKDRAALSRLKIQATRVLGFDNTGRAAEKRMDRIGLSVGQSAADPKTLSFQASSATVPGTYLITFQVFDGKAKIAEFGVLVHIEK
ncbi:MAG: hypothetical protein ABIN58_00560 [candidate division WOR-3 bacterium]